MKLYAISDLHLGYEINRRALKALSSYPEDWLILGGDIGETEGHLHFALATLTRRFQKILWVPGNHDLWTLPSDRNGLRGEPKYERLVSICRDYGVLTPEDPYVLWPGEDMAWLLVPIFVLYDYSFRPEHVSADKAIEWASESGVICADEALLHSAPYPSLSAWCAARCAYTERRLREASHAVTARMVLINHFPLRQDLVQLPRIPRFSIWCGTRCTEDWHVRFPVSVVIYGHLHVPGTHFRDGVRFEEVSLNGSHVCGDRNALEHSLREILPGPGSPPHR